MMGPIELFVTTGDDLQEAHNLYKKTWDHITKMDVFDNSDFKTGHIDDERMVCFGFKPYRIRFGTVGEAEYMQKYTMISPIQHIIPSTNFNLKENVDDYVRIELLRLINGDPNLINIGVIIPGPRRIAELRQLKSILEDRGVHSHVVENCTSNLLVIGDAGRIYVSVTVAFGSNMINCIMNGDHKWEVLTMPRFIDEMPQIVDRICKLHKKYSLIFPDRRCY